MLLLTLIIMIKCKFNHNLKLFLLFYPKKKIEMIKVKYDIRYIAVLYDSFILIYLIDIYHNIFYNK
jgi:hypothetical protein